MIPELETTLETVRRRAQTNGFLRRLVPWTAGALVAVGALVLSLRALAGAPLEDVALLFGAVPVVALSAWVAARRRAPEREAAVAWLDVSAGGTGTLLSDYELGDARWGGAAEAALARVGSLPGITPRGMLTRFGPASLFALVCLLVPIPDSLPGTTPNFFDATAERLREKLATLEEEVELDEETAAELAERFDDLEAQMAEASPEAVFEALDRLESRLQELALGASEAAERALEEAADVAREARANPESAEEDLAAMMQKLAEAGLDGDLASELSEDLAELARSLSGEELDGEENSAQMPGGLDPEKLAELARELGELLDGKLATLAEAGLLDPSKLAKAKPAKFTEVVIHDCDENCKAGGGT